MEKPMGFYWMQRFEAEVEKDVQIDADCPGLLRMGLSELNGRFVFNFWQWSEGIEWSRCMLQEAKFRSLQSAGKLKKGV